MDTPKNILIKATLLSLTQAFRTISVTLITNGMAKLATIRTLLCLHVLLGLYSIADVLSKMAAGESFLSLAFYLCYGGVLIILVVYALAWQQIIKRMPLTSAYANRAITIVWGIFWGVAFFGESLTPGKVAGALIIMAGIALFAFADNSNSTQGGECS